MKTEAEKKAEKEASYKKYKPKEDSNFHDKNRVFSQYQNKSWFEKAMLGFNPYKIQNQNW